MDNIKTPMNLNVPPEIVNKFNWGAFLLTWIWGLFNKTYLTLIIIPLSLVPKIGLLLTLILSVYFGTRGNRWALENKYFSTLEEFNKYQKKFVQFGLILLILCVLWSVIIISYIKSTELYLPDKFKQPVSISQDVLQRNQQMYSQGVQRKIYNALDENILSGNTDIILTFSINKSGEVSDIFIEKSSGDEVTDEAVIRTIKSSEPFEPFKYSDKINMRFELSPSIINTEIIEGE